MSVEIPLELEHFVAIEVASGRFEDSSAVVEHALCLMRQDREDSIAGIKTGLADVLAGRTKPLDMAFDELRKELGVSKDA